MTFSNRTAGFTIHLAGMLLLWCWMTSLWAQQEANFQQMSSNDPSEQVRLLEQTFGTTPDHRVVVVDVSAQQLYLYQQGELLGQWQVSTAEKGTGNREHSFQTPLGAHRIAQKIGNGATPGTIFRGRENSGEVATIYTDQTRSPEDYVTTRILWLEGLEPGINLGAGIDSYQRYIYIHGTPEEGRIGSPASKGCIRMRNADVIALYSQLKSGTLVYIQE